MPVRYKRPASLKDAQVFVGAHVRVHWVKTPSSPAGWFKGIVAGVKFCLDEAEQNSRTKKELCFHIE